MKNAIQVAFQGATLFVVEHQQQPYVPMKHVVEGMGIDWRGQQAKLKANPRWGMEEISIPSNGGEQKASCIPLRKLPGWMSSIHPNKVKPELRDKIIAFQNECDDILWAAWQEKTKPALSHLITVAQQGELATLIAERFPNGKHRPYAWSRFNNHFRIASYKSLPAEKFAEACDYIASLPVKQEALPAPSLLNRRWLVSYDANGKEQVQPVPDDACVMSLPRLLEAINEPNGMMVETQVLADFAVATIQRIAKRCEYYKTVSQGKPVTLNW